MVDEEKCIADQRLHGLRRRLPAGRAAHQRAHRQGLHEVRRVLVLHAVRGRLPDRGGDGRHPLPAAVRAGGMDTVGLFESFGDLEVLAGRLDDADASARRVAVMELGRHGRSRRGTAPPARARRPGGRGPPPGRDRARRVRRAGGRGGPGVRPGRPRAPRGRGRGREPHGAQGPRGGRAAARRHGPLEPVRPPLAAARPQGPAPARGAPARGRGPGRPGPRGPGPGRGRDRLAEARRGAPRARRRVARPEPRGAPRRRERARLLPLAARGRRDRGGPRGPGLAGARDGGGDGRQGRQARGTRGRSSPGWRTSAGRCA